MTARRSIPSLGHHWDATLVCACGRSWAEHQRAPTPCDGAKRRSVVRDDEVGLPMPEEGESA